MSQSVCVEELDPLAGRAFGMLTLLERVGAGERTPKREEGDQV